MGMDFRRTVVVLLVLWRLVCLVVKVRKVGAEKVRMLA